MNFIPWILSAVTITSMWMAGSRHRYAWAISTLNQSLWLSWILTSQTWGFLPMNICMFVVSIRNHMQWQGGDPVRAERDKLLDFYHGIVEYLGHDRIVLAHANLKIELAGARATIEELEGYLRTVRKDRVHRDQHGNEFMGQTEDWCDGCIEKAEEARIAVERLNHFLKP